MALHQWSLFTYVLGPVIGAVVGFNLYNLLFVETEVAEMAEAKAEKAEIAKEVKSAAKRPADTKKKTATRKAPAKRKTPAKK